MKQLLLQGVFTFLSWFNSAGSEQKATEFALIYGYPVGSYLNFSLATAQNPDCNNALSVNTLCVHTALPDYTFREIVRPNVDTLYSASLIDVSQSDVELVVPSIPDDRFWVFPFYDLYGNNFANIGTVNNSQPGQYLIRFRPSNPGVEPGNPPYQQTIYMPTAYGAGLLRVQVDNSSDAKYVGTNIQSKFNLAPGANSMPLAPKLTKSLLTDGLYGNQAEQLLQLTARLAPFNPPEVSRDVPWVTSTLRLAGLMRGTYTTPSGVDLAAAVNSSITQTLSVVNDTRYWITLSPQWFTTKSDVSGDFHSNYLMRAFIAYWGYLQLADYEALYPSFSGGTLYANTSYVVTFGGGKPTVTGFWSLTVYGSDEYLVENQLGRYSLGDRSDITYDDGNLVYGPESSDPTKPFSLLLQSTDFAPAENWTSNWIPTPALNASGDGTFTITLRFYGPTKSLLDKSYTYPVVQPSNRV